MSVESMTTTLRPDNQLPVPQRNSSLEVAVLQSWLNLPNLPSPTLARSEFYNDQDSDDGDGDFGDLLSMLDADYGDHDDGDAAAIDEVVDMMEQGQEDSAHHQQWKQPPSSCVSAKDAAAAVYRELQIRQQAACMTAACTTAPGIASATSTTRTTSTVSTTSTADTTSTSSHGNSSILPVPLLPCVPLMPLLPTFAACTTAGTTTGTTTGSTARSLELTRARALITPPSMLTLLTPSAETTANVSNVSNVSRCLQPQQRLDLMRMRRQREEWDQQQMRLQRHHQQFTASVSSPTVGDALHSKPSSAAASRPPSFVVSLQKSLHEASKPKTQPKAKAAVKNAGGSRGKFKKATAKRWTAEETECLAQGVGMFGVGSWLKIKNHFYHQLRDRSNVDLKDRWRNVGGPRQSQKRKNHTHTVVATATVVPNGVCKRARMGMVAVS